MTDELDFAVAQAIFRAQQIERALHDRGPWTMEWAGHTVPACRLIGKREITFLAHFPEHCYLAEPEPTMTLLCRGQVVGTRTIDFPGDGAFQVEWRLAVEQSVLV